MLPGSESGAIIRPDVHITIPNDCGQFSPHDSRALATIYRDILTGIKNPLVGELGCWIGSSTIATAREITKYGGSLIAIDWFKGSTGVNKHLAELAGKNDIFNTFMENIKWAGIKNVSILRMDSETASKIVGNRTFDVFFIDGDHEYEFVGQDIKLWLQKVKKGGVLCGHDYNKSHPGVIKAVGEAFEGKEKTYTKANIWWVKV